MPIPNLIHPIPIKIQQLDLTETYQDDDYREPVQQALYEETKTVKGQALFGSEEELRVKLGGVVAGAAGYVLFRYHDLNAKDIDLKLNDRFIKIGNLKMDAYIIKLTPKGHYSDVGGATLLMAVFTDRAPARLGLDV